MGSTEDVPVLLEGCDEATASPLRRGFALRMAGLAVLLLRAAAILLLFSPALLLLAWALR